MDQLENCLLDGFRLLAFEEKEIRFRIPDELGHASRIDLVGVCDDAAAGSLAKNLCEADNRDRAAADDITEGGSRSNAGELVHIADEEDVGIFRESPQQLA